VKSITGIELMTSEMKEAERDLLVWRGKEVIVSSPFHWVWV